MATGHKKIALDPAESSAINDAPLLGQGRRRLELWFRAPRQVGGPAVLPGYSVVQASLRCCGMPASRARTSASR